MLVNSRLTYSPRALRSLGRLDTQYPAQLSRGGASDGEHFTGAGRQGNRIFDHGPVQMAAMTLRTGLRSPSFTMSRFALMTLASNGFAHFKASNTLTE